MRSIVRVMATHQRNGERPERNMIVRVPTPLYKRIQEIAKTEQRTLSAEVRWLMERRVREAEADTELEEAA